MDKLQAVSGCFLVFVVCCNAHLCLLSPPQRGPPMEEALNKAGSDLCFRLESPCGKQKESQNVITVRAGEFQVIFQKNLDHYNDTLTSHGFFRISLRYEDHSLQLKDVQDKGEKSLHLYTAMVNIASFKHRTIENMFAAKRLFKWPSKGKEITDIADRSEHRKTYQLQVVYYTKNDEVAPPAFYQCADIHIRE